MRFFSSQERIVAALMPHCFAALTRERPCAFRAALMRSSIGFFPISEDFICKLVAPYRIDTCIKAFSHDPTMKLPLLATLAIAVSPEQLQAQ